MTLNRQQSVHLEIDYPDVEQDLNRWLPLVKWLLAIRHHGAEQVAPEVPILGTVLNPRH